MTVKYGVLLGLVLLLGFFSGVLFQSQTTSGLTDNPYAQIVEGSEHLLEKGETARIGGMDVTVHEAYETEEEGETFLVVDVSFFNATEEVKEISLFNTLVVNDEGYTYEYHDNYDDKRLIGGQLRPEGQRRGTLAFKVEPSSYYEFTYTDHMRKGQVAWAVKTAS